MTVFVAGELRGHRPILAQRRDHVIGVDPNHRPLSRHLDHHVELGSLVVQDAEADPRIVQVGRHIEIRDRGIEPAARVIVEQQLAPAGACGKRKHHLHRAPRHHPRTGDHPVPIQRARNETSRPPAAEISLAR